MMIKKVSSNLTPLCYLPSGKLVCYTKGRLIILNNDIVEAVQQIFSSIKEKIVERITALYRLLRLGIRAAIALDEDNILLSVKNIIYEYNIKGNRLSKGFVLPVGVRPLIFTEVKNIEGFRDGIIFGGYLGNDLKKPVCIYRRTGDDKWETVHTFSDGEINHVHNVVADKYHSCLWIFTGDFGESAAIYKVTNDFKKVERILCNDQRYRGCVVFPIPEGLLYATDAPFMNNHIYLLSLNDNGKPLSLTELADINGSCIYGCKFGDKYAFSSTVEPDGRNASLKRYIFDYSIGAGIKDRYSHLYIGNVKEGFKDVLKLKKDLLPFLFQFGTIRFPSGENHSDTLYFQPIATQKNMTLMSFNE